MHVMIPIAKQAVQTMELHSAQTADYHVIHTALQLKRMDVTLDVQVDVLMDAALCVMDVQALTVVEHALLPVSLPVCLEACQVHILLTHMLVLIVQHLL